MVTGLWHTNDPNFGSLSWIWRCKEHPNPLSPHLGLWRMLEVPQWVWHLYLDLDMVTCLWYTHAPNFGSRSWFWRCKEHPCPLCPDLGLWRTLEVPDWGLASWSWFGYGHWSLIHPLSEFLISTLIMRVQNPSQEHPVSSKALNKDLKDRDVLCNYEIEITVQN